jgi:hypothetical protein
MSAHATVSPPGIRKPPQSEKRHRLKQPKTVAELYALHEELAEQAKALYDQKDEVLKKLWRAWKKDRRALVDDGHYLDIEDTWRGQMKAFAPAFSHRLKIKVRSTEVA